MEHARARGIEDGLGAMFGRRRLKDGGGEVSNMVRIEAVGGRAALCAVYRNIIERSW